MRQHPGNGPDAGMRQQDLDRLVERVQRELSGRLHDFRLKRQGDGVVLAGRVRSYYAKQLAQNAVMRSTALPILANEIEVL
jgi:hypothetical protein